MTGYTGFNGEDPEEQEGYYFPFKLAKAGTTMSFEKTESPGRLISRGKQIMYSE